MYTRRDFSVWSGYGGAHYAWIKVVLDVGDRTRVLQGRSQPRSPEPSGNVYDHFLATQGNQQLHMKERWAIGDIRVRGTMCPPRLLIPKGQWVNVFADFVWG